MIPFAIGRSFDILRAVAAGDGAAIGRFTAPTEAGRAAVLLAEEPYRSAAVAWVARPDRAVKAWTDGLRTLVRFHVDASRNAFVIVLEGPYFTGYATMPEADLETFGSVVHG